MNTNKTEITAHTPLPWYVERVTPEFIEINSEPAEYSVATMNHDPRDTAEMDANAEYIVRAANAHHKLVEALEAAVAAGEYVVNLAHANDKAGQSPSPTERADWVGTCAHMYAAMSFLNDARSALQLARNGGKE